MSWTQCRAFLLPGFVSFLRMKFARPPLRPTFKLYDQRTESQHPRLNASEASWHKFLSQLFASPQNTELTPYLIKFYIVELVRAEKTCLMCCHTYGLAIYSNFSISTLHVNNAARFTDSRVVFIAAQRALALCERCSAADGTLAYRFSILMTLLIKNSMLSRLKFPCKNKQKPPLAFAPAGAVAGNASVSECFEHLQLWERSHLCSDPN